LFSRALVDALAQARASGEQAVVLLNRRGYAAFAQCRACGEPIGCPRCSVSLVYHRSDETLRCHYCDHRRPRPETCPSCASPHVVFVGEGTERIERHLERLFPEARVARLDRDTARGANAHERILQGFEEGAFDFLIGTQMVAKGHDYPGVTVVGVLEADAILGFPDFRAAERTFQLLTQVAGRAGRGTRPGRVIVQAYRCGHYALTAAARHDHQGFFDREILYRRSLGYPPFTVLAALTVVGKDLADVGKRARRLAVLLTEHGEGRVQVLGPALAPLARLRGLFRVQILLKARARTRLGDALRRTLDALSSERGGTRDLVVDVDPYQLL
jgi:primosomal protein N' (replication factor Y)